MPKRKLPYQPGDWIAIPLASGDFALGLIARADGRGLVLGYFFSERFSAVPTMRDTEGRSARTAFLVRQFGDLALIRGEWPILGKHPEWNPQDWPMPVFGRLNRSEGLAWRVEYDEDSLEVVRETPVGLDEAERLPADGLSGAAALPLMLAARLPHASQS